MSIATNATHLRDRTISSSAPSEDDVLIWNDTTKKWEPGAQTGGSIPTGTGFRHITAGAEDSTAKLVENADVSGSAAIVESKVAFDNSTGHEHNGTDSKKVDHTDLLTIGTNTHATIDTFIASKGAANGLCPLNSSTKVDGDYLAVATSTKRGGVPATTSSGTKVLYDNDTWAEPPGASGGEANTASNVGGGLGLFKQKSGVDLEFKTLNSGEFSESSDVVSVLAVAESKVTFNTSTGHAHTGSDSTQVDHADLLSIGSNTHATIDAFIASKGAASGIASLNASSKVVEDPANATSTPAASKIPIADSGATVDDWVTKFDVMRGIIERVSDTSLKWGFLYSNQAKLFSNTAGGWRLVQMSSEPTKGNTDNDMGSTQLTYDKNYDVFLVYSSATAATLALAPWATDSARYAAWVTSHGYKIGDRVSESGSYYACVEAHTSGTFADDLSAGKWILVSGAGDNLALGILDGIPVYAASGAWREYRYVGVVRLRSDTGAKFTDQMSKRWIANRYNSRERAFGMPNPYSSTTYEQCNSSGWYAWDGDGNTWQVSCVLEHATQVTLCAHALLTGGTNPGQVGIGVDSKTTLATNASSAHSKVASSSAGSVSLYSDQVSLGYHYFHALQRSQTAGPNIYYWYEDTYLKTHAQFNGSVG